MASSAWYVFDVRDKWTMVYAETRRWAAWKARQRYPGVQVKAVVTPRELGGQLDRRDHL